METSKLLRFGAISGVLGGAVIAVFNIVEYLAFSGAPISTLANRPGWVAFQAAGLVGIAFVVVGLFGLYALQASRAGTLGLIGFSVALLGVLQYDGLSWAAAFVLPSVGRAAPAVLDTPDPLLGTGLIATVLVSAVGWLLFAVATLRAGVFPRWASILMIVGAIAPFITQAMGSALPVGAVAIGVAMIGMGYSTLTWDVSPPLRRATA